MSPTYSHYPVASSRNGFTGYPKHKLQMHPYQFVGPRFFRLIQFGESLTNTKQTMPARQRIQTSIPKSRSIIRCPKARALSCKYEANLVICAARAPPPAPRPSAAPDELEQPFRAPLISKVQFRAHITTSKSTFFCFHKQILAVVGGYICHACAIATL